MSFFVSFFFLKHRKISHTNKKTAFEHQCCKKIKFGFYLTHIDNK